MARSPLLCAVALLSQSLLLPLHALDLKFRSESDFEKNFTPAAGAKAFSFVHQDGGAIRFQSAEKLTFGRLTLVDDKKRPLGLSDGTMEALFRFRQVDESFGIMARITGASDPCYVFLVNFSANQIATLRIFKVPADVMPDQETVLAYKTSKDVVLDTWYRLRIKMTTKGGKAVNMRAEIVPENGGRELAGVEVLDENGPILSPGRIDLRFFSATPDARIEAKALSVTPNPIPLK